MQELEGKTVSSMTCGSMWSAIFLETEEVSGGSLHVLAICLNDRQAKVYGTLPFEMLP